MKIIVRVLWFALSVIGVLAVLKYGFDLASKRAWAIVILSIVILFLLYAIELLRRFHEKTVKELNAIREIETWEFNGRIEGIEQEKILLKSQLDERVAELERCKRPQVEIIYDFKSPYKVVYLHGNWRRVEYFIGVKSSIPIEDLRVDIEDSNGRFLQQLYERGDALPYKPLIATEPEKESFFHLATIANEPAGLTSGHIPKIEIGTEGISHFPYGRFCIVVRGSNTLPCKRYFGFKTSVGGSTDFRPYD